MWVVITSIVPLLWMLLEANVKQKPKEKQDKFWLTFLLVYLTVGCIFTVLNSATNMTAVIIMLPVAIATPPLILKAFFWSIDFIHNKCQKNGTGLLGELKMTILMDILLLVILVVVVWLFG